MERNLMFAASVFAVLSSTASITNGQAPLPVQVSVLHYEVVQEKQGVSVSAGSVLQRSESPLDRIISVAFDRTPVADAIAEIAEGAMLKLAARKSILGTTQVTFKADRITAREAFAKALAGTNLTVLDAGNGQYTIVTAARVQGTITGKVVHAKTKQPIAGAKITLAASSAVATTGEDGSFQIAAPVGSQTMHVRALGYVRTSQHVSVPEDGSVSVEVALEPSASVLDEVVVTGTVVATERKAISTPITVITAADIEKRGITRVEDLLRGEVPGVIAIDPGMGRYAGVRLNGGRDELGNMVRTDVYVRGNASVSSTNGTPNPLKTFVDGVEMLDPAYLGTIDPSTIERIEIVTGPQAATIYGSGAMGGVMQIFTKKGSLSQTPEMTVSLKYGILQNSFSQGLTPSHNHGLTLNGSSGPNLAYTGTLSYRYSGQWQPKLFARTYAGSIGLTHTTGPLNLNGSFSMSNGANGTTGWWSVTSTPLNDALVRSGEFTPRTIASSIGDRISRSSSLTAALNASYQLRPWWQHTVTLGRSQNDFEMDPVAPGYARPYDSLYQTSSSAGKRTTASYNTTLTPAPYGIFSSSLTIGTNGSWGAQINSTGCLATKVSTNYIEGCRNDLGVTRSVNSSSWGGFASLRAGAWDKLYFTFGLRGESNPNYGREHRIDWTPTTGLSYTLEAGNLAVKFLGSYGRATKPPTPDMRSEAWSTVLVDNLENLNWYLGRFAAPHLRPEYSRGPQGGVEVYYGNIATFTINRYVQQVTDLIQSVIVDSIPVTWLRDPWIYTEYGLSQRQYLNVASIRQHGLEGTGSLNVGPMNVRGTWSWSDSRVTSSQVTTYYPGRSFRNIPTHTGSVAIAYARGGTAVTMTTNFMGSMVRQISSSSQGDYLCACWRLKEYLDTRNTASGDVSFPGYSISDLAATHRLNNIATLTLNVTNLGNNFTSDHGRALPKLGRTTTMGVSLRFK